jgi:hypothetical protein
MTKKIISILFILLLTHNFCNAQYNGLHLVEKYTLKDIENKFYDFDVIIDRRSQSYSNSKKEDLKIEIKERSNQKVKVRIELNEYDDYNGGYLMRLDVYNIPDSEALRIYEQAKSNYGTPHSGYEQKCSSSVPSMNYYVERFSALVHYYDKGRKGSFLEVSISPFYCYGCTTSSVILSYRIDTPFGKPRSPEPFDNCTVIRKY